MSDKSDVPLLTIILLATAAGAAVGWTGRGIYDGSTISVKDATTQAQDFVEAGVESAAIVDQGRADVEQAQGKVTVVIREVPVDAECKPGAGPVSPEWDSQLRALEQARSDPADTAGSRGRLSSEGRQ